MNHSQEYELQEGQIVYFNKNFAELEPGHDPWPNISPGLHKVKLAKRVCKDSGAFLFYQNVFDGEQSCSNGVVDGDGDTVIITGTALPQMFVPVQDTVISPSTVIN